MRINHFHLEEQPREKEKNLFFLLETNHLGNVMEVVSDRKIAVDENTYDAVTGDFVTATSDLVIDWYEADVVQYSDYYPYGMTMSGRNGSIAETYRYAFNGMEADGEVSGSGNSYTTQFRQYDPRLGRWKSLDPLAAKFPWQSPFCAMDNNPVVLTDPLGLSTGNNDDPPSGSGTKSDPYQVNTYEDGYKVLDGIKSPGVEDAVYFTNGRTTSKAIWNGASWETTWGSSNSDESTWTRGGSRPGSAANLEFVDRVGSIGGGSVKDRQLVNIEGSILIFPEGRSGKVYSKDFTDHDFNSLARAGIPLSIGHKNSGLHEIWDYLMDNRILDHQGLRYTYSDEGFIETISMIPKSGNGPAEWISGPGAGMKTLSGVKTFTRGSKTFKLTQGTAKSGWKHIFDRHVDLSRFVSKTKFATGMTQEQVLELLSRTIKHGKMSVYQGKTVFTFRQSFNGVYKQYRVTINADGTIQTFHALN